MADSFWANKECPSDLKRLAGHLLPQLGAVATKRFRPALVREPLSRSPIQALSRRGLCIELCLLSCRKQSSPSRDFATGRRDFQFRVLLRIDAVVPKPLSSPSAERALQVIPHRMILRLVRDVQYRSHAQLVPDSESFR